MIAASRPILALLGLTLGLTLHAQAGGGIYRWVDEQGRVHFQDQPVAGAEQLRAPGEDDESAADGLRRAKVDWVLDGDTLELTSGERVRLIGINTPEVAHRSRPGQPGGEEAKAALIKLARGETLQLEPDVEQQDRYGRTLAHLHHPELGNLNALLLLRGLAHVTIHPPNLTHIEDYLAAQHAARAAGIGIWALPDYQPKSTDQALALRNSYRRIQGRISAVETRDDHTVLHFVGDFTATLDADARERFKKQGIWPSTLLGRTAIVSGWIKKRRDKAYVRLEHPGQLELR